MPDFRGPKTDRRKWNIRNMIYILSSKTNSFILGEQGSKYTLRGNFYLRKVRWRAITMNDI